MSEAEQAVALSIYKGGNADFEEARYAQALAKYREAILHWEHPAIRFNMAVCLINLDQPVEAADDLELALKYGDAALGPEVYTQGLTYRKLLDGQLSRLEVVGKQPGVEITLDGKSILTAPGDRTLRVRPGNHQLVATKPGLVTRTIALALPPGEVVRQEIALVEVAAAAKTVRRWAPWKPWALLGAGVASGLVGGGFEILASRSYSRYSEAFAAGGVCANGCGGKNQPPLPSKTTARIENDTAISLFGLGGAAIVAGVASVYLNQPHITLAQERDLRVAPTVGPNGVSLVLDGRF